MADVSPAPLTIRHPRLAAYQQLIASMHRSQGSASGVWLDFLSRLPLTLGESEAERSVMVSVSDTVNDALTRAVDGLTDLIKRRADPAYEREKKTALLPDESQRVVLWPRRFCPRTVSGDSPLRQVVRLALLQSADLDAGLLEGWLSRSGGGQRLFDVVRALLAKALTVSRSQTDFSGVALMSHLAVMNALLDAKERVKEASAKNMSYARLERAVGMALHACFNRAIHSTLASEPALPRGSPEYNDRVLILSTLGPLIFISIRKAEFASDVNPYGLSDEVEDLLGPIYQSVLERGNQPLYLLHQCMLGAQSRTALLGLFLRQATCEGFRRLALNHLLQSEDTSKECDLRLAEAFHQNAALIDLLEEPSTLGGLVTDLKKRLLTEQKPDQPMAETFDLLNFLERVLERGPPWQVLMPEDEGMMQDAVERFLLNQLDEFAAAHVEHARRRVTDRRKESPTSVLIQEYEAGRLYRISVDDQPLVKARVLAFEGQLFVDLKGYTRRTAKAKELVMADFLQKEFYEPILDAAKKYHTSVSVTGGEEAMRLVNLLGDAVAFSGDIVSLIGLAHDIQTIFRDYGRKLQHLSPLEEESAFLTTQRQVDERQAGILAEMEELKNRLRPVKEEVYRRSALDANAMVAQLQRDYQDQFERLQREHSATQEQVKATPEPALKARLHELKTAHVRLKAHRQDTLKRLKGVGGEDLTLQLSDSLCRRLLTQVRDIEERIRALEEEDRTLTDALEEERSLQLGTGLEAGLFISFGSASEIIEIDDDIWGTQRVAISERINEAARGTARNPTVMRIYDEMLAAARSQQNNPGLELPFRVAIAHTRAFDLEPSLVRMWTKAMAEKDSELLNSFIGALHAQVLRQFGEEDEEQGQGQKPHPMNDIYNLGEALSGQALDAYLGQTRTTHFFFRVQVRTAELHTELRQRFFIPDEILSLIVGWKLTAGSDERTEVFRYAGQILFRGFEVTRPTQVFEILRPDSPFVRILAKHHLPVWLEEARQNPECKLDGLTPPRAV